MAESATKESGIHNSPPASACRKTLCGLFRTVFQNLLGILSIAVVASNVAATPNSPSGSYEYELLHSFVPSDGTPHDTLRQDAQGNVYGSTAGGGPYWAESVYRLDRLGHYGLLHGTETLFVSGILAQDGNIYGVTTCNVIDGTTANQHNCMYRLDPAGNVTTLREYTDYGPNDSGLLRAPDGSLYGLRYAVVGHNNWYQEIYRLSPKGELSRIATHYDLLDGLAMMNVGADGNLYLMGWRWKDGANRFGLRRLMPTGEEAYVGDDWESVNDDTPWYKFVTGPDGAFYGVAITYRDASTRIFKVDTQGHFTILHRLKPESFKDRPDRITVDGAGNVYWILPQGGAANAGELWRWAPDGTVRLLHSFGGQEGSAPFRTLLADPRGHLYGLTTAGGQFGAGTLYRLDPSGTLRVLHDFSLAGGVAPEGDLVPGSDGALYGTTLTGGTKRAGTLFRFDPAGRALQFLHDFDFPPTAGLSRGPDKALYGLTQNGYGRPALFRWGHGFAMTPVLTYSYGEVYAASLPIAGLDGNFYFVADSRFYGMQGGPTVGSGNLFEVDPSSNIYALQYELVRDASGNFYGARGCLDYFRPCTLYRFAPHTSPETLLDVNGNRSLVGRHHLLPNASGDLVGVVEGSREAGTSGTVYRLTHRDGYQIVHQFGKDYGEAPKSALVRTREGMMVGTTATGGAFGQGTIYRLTPEGQLSVIHHFNGKEGAGPHAGLLLAADGHLYGTTTRGGQYGTGTVYRLRSTHNDPVILSAGAGPFLPHQPLSLTVMVRDPIATGTVEVIQEEVSIGMAQLTHGQVTMMVSDLDAGSYHFKARFRSNSNQPIEDSAPLIVVVANDLTPPVIAVTLSPSRSDTEEGAWYRRPVAIHWTLFDAESPARIIEGCEEGLQTQDMNRAFLCTAESAGGRQTETYSLHIDITPPTITGLPKRIGRLTTRTQGVVINYPKPSFADALSEIANSQCSQVSGSVFSVGNTNVSCTATDRAGNTATVTFPVIVKHLPLPESMEPYLESLSKWLK